MPWAPFPPAREAAGNPAGATAAARDQVAAMLPVLARHAPDAFALFARHIRVIGLLPPDGPDVFNASHSIYHGGFVVAAINHPYELAAYAIHELAHNLLFALERQDPLLTGDQATYAGPALYSPWREDLRPVRGTMHAVFVHLPVCRFWLDVAGSGDGPSDLSAYARDQLCRFLIQIDIGLETLERHAHPTPSGQRLLATLGRDAQALIGAARSLDLDPDTGALVCRPDGAVVSDRRDGHPRSIRAALHDHAGTGGAPSWVAAVIDRTMRRPVDAA